MKSPARSSFASPWWGARGAEERIARTLTLDRDATLRLRPRAGGLLLRCRSGAMLATQEGDPLDHVLGPGDRLRVAGRGLVVVWALSQGELELEPAAAAEPLGAAVAAGASVH